jgi:ribosome-associated protein
MSEFTSLDKTKLAANAALEKVASDIVAIDVHDVVSFADFFLIASGRSDRQVRSIAEGIAVAIKKNGDRVLGVEGVDEGRWVLIDLGDVIVHVFQEKVRAEYDLERLWSDAPPVDLGLPPEETGVRVVGGNPG